MPKQCAHQFLLFVLSFLAFGAQAQSDINIRSDRPGQATSAFTVGAGVLQFQQGLEYDKAKSRRERYKSAAMEHVLRLGVNESFEINTLLSFQKSKNVANDIRSHSSGLNSLQLGFKKHLSNQHVCIPNSALQIRVSVPFVYKNTNTYLESNVLLSSNWALGKGFSINNNLIYILYPYQSKSMAKYVLNLNFPVYKNFSGFIENYGQLQSSSFETRYDGGFSYLLNKNVLIDLSAGLGKNYGKRDFFIAAGISWRILHS